MTETNTPNVFEGCAVSPLLENFGVIVTEEGNFAQKEYFKAYDETDADGRVLFFETSSLAYAGTHFALVFGGRWLPVVLLAPMRADRVTYLAMLKDSVSVRVRDPESFGRLCVALSDDSVLFTHAGFHTMLIREYDFNHLPVTSKKLFQELTDRKAVEVTLHPPDAKARRKLPSPSEAASLLEKFSKQ